MRPHTNYTDPLIANRGKLKEDVEKLVKEYLQANPHTLNFETAWQFLAIHNNAYKHKVAILTHERFEQAMRGRLADVEEMQKIIDEHRTDVGALMIAIMRASGVYK